MLEHIYVLSHFMTSLLALTIVLLPELECFKNYTYLHACPFWLYDVAGGRVVKVAARKGVNHTFSTNHPKWVRSRCVIEFFMTVLKCLSFLIFYTPGSNDRGILFLSCPFVCMFVSCQLEPSL